MKTIQIGHRVRFAKDVVKRCCYSKVVTDMRGKVICLHSHDKVAEVDVNGTLQFIPVANLVSLHNFK